MIATRRLLLAPGDTPLHHLPGVGLVPSSPFLLMRSAEIMARFESVESAQKFALQTGLMLGGEKNGPSFGIISPPHWIQHEEDLMKSPPHPYQLMMVRL